MKTRQELVVLRYVEEAKDWVEYASYLISVETPTYSVSNIEYVEESNSYASKLEGKTKIILRTISVAD